MDTLFFDYSIKIKKLEF